MNVLLVFLGGGAGAVARYLAGLGYGRAFGAERPWIATLAVNVLGGLLMGLLVGWLARAQGPAPERWRVFLGVGILGGFTTFSSFSLEAFQMLERKAFGMFTAYVAGSTVLSILALMLGLALMRRLAA